MLSPAAMGHQRVVQPGDAGVCPLGGTGCRAGTATWVLGGLVMRGHAPPALGPGTGPALSPSLSLSLSPAPALRPAGPTCAHCACVAPGRGDYKSRQAPRLPRMRGGGLSPAAILKSEPQAGRRRGRSILGGGGGRRSGGACEGGGQPGVRGSPGEGGQ